MIAVGSLMLVGCQPSKVPVRGQVTLDGQPLSEAVIVFVPLEAGIKKTGASIRGGAYELVEIDGLLPGKYRVEVVDDPPLTLAHRPLPETNVALQTRRTIPLRYSQESPLSLEIGEHSSLNLQQLDFKLESNQHP
jgi:hypothetical protein